MDFLTGLNDKQQEAVQTINGPVLIIAGAGSGKTKALTHRIAHIIAHHGVAPDRILAVTFTNKAAHEMKERIKILLQDLHLHTEPLVGTFHSICVRILRKEIHLLGYENSFSIYDSADQLALMKVLMKEEHMDEKQYNPKAILGAISNAKNELILPEKYHTHVSTPFHEAVALLYPKYQRELTKARALDFDDLLMKTVLIFQEHPHILEKYQDRFQYISVDEYQDTNHAQYTLIKLLSDKNKNICVIGDDWQSIYSWRGANMKNILTFEKDFPNTKVIYLEQNYRSSKTIVEAANALIAKNKERSDKKLWTEKENEYRISVLEAQDERHEADHIVQLITARRHQGTPLKDMAILYRTNAQSRVFEETLMRHGVPYIIIGGVKFYERKEIKDMLAYLKLILNPRDTMSFLRVINVPARKIGPKTLETLQLYASQLNLSLFEIVESVEEISDFPPQALNGLCSFREVIRSCSAANKEMSASGVMKHVLKLAKYEEYLLDGTDEGEERFQNVLELINVASKYDLLEPGISLATFLEEVALVSDLDTLNESDDNAVILMTLHASKGLEYHDVYIAGLEEGIFPSSRSHMDISSLEEERRLMYVGMTRARERLHLSYAKSRLYYGDYKYFPTSRFLADIPEEYIEENHQKKRAHALLSSAYNDEPRYAPLDEEIRYNTIQFETGDEVLHRAWGQGTVLAVQGDVLTIRFYNSAIGVKKVAANIAPLKKVE